MKELLDRLQAPTPKFWKRIQNAALSLFLLTGAISAGSLDVNGTSVAFELPPMLENVVQHIATISAVVFVVAKFAVEGTYGENKGE